MLEGGGQAFEGATDGGAIASSGRRCPTSSPLNAIADSGRRSSVLGHTAPGVGGFDAIAPRREVEVEHRALEQMTDPGRPRSPCPGWSTRGRRCSWPSNVAPTTAWSKPLVPCAGVALLRPLAHPFDVRRSRVVDARCRSDVTRDLDPFHPPSPAQRRTGQFIGADAADLVVAREAAGQHVGPEHGERTHAFVGDASLQQSDIAVHERVVAHGLSPHTSDWNRNTTSASRPIRARWWPCSCGE